MASYQQRESGKWSVRFRISVDGKEKTVRLSGFKTKKQAQSAYIEYMNDLKARTISEQELNSPENLDFDVLISAFLEYKQKRLKESSFYTMNHKIASNIEPFFKDKKVKDITPLTILQWQDSIDHYSYAHKSALRSLLSSIYKFGERYYNINNIMGKVEPFRNLEPKKEMLYWSLDEFKQFINEVEDVTHKTFFEFLYISGCRKGEALALQWNDVNFSKNTVRINKNITKQTADGGWKIVTPKNASSNRVIDIPQFFMDKLKSYKSSVAQPGEFVFGGARPLANTTIDRIFNNACMQSGVKKIRIHDLRHSCASFLISEGVSIVAVSKRLGHKNIEQTLNTYSHMMPSDISKMIGALDKINS